ncbi:MAG: toll/interleukin-1 receptor domain-containing protein [Thermodesulfovibrionales bacterium]|nr:toll/interleukin-1 receptor domain-containing protein [Thermodesulfovibrionales bacterium]
MNPKVFISHASEDKQRFVLDFATKLRSKGIDAWIDRWEMLPGDSLVDKVFEEGIKNAQAVIVVLSKNSVNKKWVREELNASMVKRINKGSKLIPVVIDDCEVPECLESTVWEKIDDLNNYATELNRIVMSIYGQTEKPPLGNPPAYTETIIDTLPNLTNIDNIILKHACEKAVESGMPSIETESILGDIKSQDIPEDELIVSLEVLDKNGYIEIHGDSGGGIPYFNISLYGFYEYAKKYIPDYNKIVDSVAFQIVNLNMEDNKSISASLNQPQMIVDHILDLLESKGYITLAKTFGLTHIVRVFPTLERILKE